MLRLGSKVRRTEMLGTQILFLNQVLRFSLRGKVDSSRVLQEVSK